MIETILLREMMIMLRVIIIMMKMSNKFHGHLIHIMTQRLTMTYYSDKPAQSDNDI